jgi:hypothetical protein
MRYSVSVSWSMGCEGITVFHVHARGAEMALRCASVTPPSCFFIACAALREASNESELACTLSALWREEERDEDALS